MMCAKYRRIMCARSPFIEIKQMAFQYCVRIRRPRILVAQLTVKILRQLFTLIQAAVIIHWSLCKLLSSQIMILNITLHAVFLKFTIYLHLRIFRILLTVIGYVNCGPSSWIVTVFEARTRR